jgi:ABC-type hemin transport system ATPase subunit
MDDALLDVVLRRLEDQPLAENAAALLLAALRGDALLPYTDGLAGLLGGQATGGPAGEQSGRSGKMARAYLRSVTVAGFRGVGQPATLDLQPGPGLTLVVGRNGSGKSSFAEALEVLLTGELRRWQKRPAVWREGWRNLHAPDGARIDASFLLEDAGEVTISRSWDSSDDVADSRVSGLDRLNWDDALGAYRPFLTHTELESFLGSPSELYDMLAAVLGLEDLTLAGARLAAERGLREAAVRAVTGELPGLLARLAGTEDERAAACLAALEKKRPDTERARALTSGNAVAPEDGTIGVLRRLAALGIPSAEEVSSVAGALARAGEGLEATAGSRSEEARALADLLEAAVAHHRAHGDGPCPVCGQAAALSAAWAEGASAEVARLRSQAGAAEAARRAAASAADAARRLFSPVPAVLTSAPPSSGRSSGRSSGPVPADVVRAAAQAWQAWVACPDVSGGRADELRDMAAHIGQTWPGLRDSVAALAAAAEAEMRSREDRWAPLARDVAAWCVSRQRADDDVAVVGSVKAAQAWLRSATDGIRNARLAPLAEHARAIWAQLRQDSNVSLDTIRLSGSRNRRQADVAATVDGLDSPALAVMSQGEVNALALSVFLPHAMLPASPFGFVVIDDPVQAMDPAKVDGLARVLAEASRSVQVVVFTHDDRVTRAVRHLGIPAHILEVTRRPGSVTEVRAALTPAQQHLLDAGALCADPRLPSGVAAQVVPGLCRLAVEAAFAEAIWRRGLRAGQRHADIEDAIEAASKPKQRPALAMFGDPERTVQVYPRLNHWAPWAADTFRSVNEGAHVGHAADVRRLVGDTRRLVELIETKLP